MPSWTPINNDPRDKEILLAFVLKKPREYILAHPEIRLTFWQKIHLNQLLKKRQHGIPLAYLTGHKEFFGLDFLVNKHTLIPRPETELLVETTLDIIKKKSLARNNGRGTLIIDIGTGSGCIPITIGHKIEKLGIKNIKISAVDISYFALRVAKKNAIHHSIPINFYQGNLLAPLFLTPDIWSYDDYIITANLPYLTQEEFVGEPSIQHEPKKALVADADDGLSLYKILIQQLIALQKPLGSLTVLFEINPGQTETLTKRIRSTFTRATIEIEIKKDLAGHDRLVIVSLFREK